MIKIYKIMILPMIFFALPAFAEDWPAPIQCAVETKVGRGPTEGEWLSGMTYGGFTKAVRLNVADHTGRITQEVFNFDFKVQLTSTDLYTLSITDIDRNTTLSNEVSVPGGGSGPGNLTLAQNYPASAGVGVSYSRFTVALKCDLRSQVSSDIPDVTPGPPR